MQWWCVDAGYAFTVALMFWGMERAVREFGFAVRSGEAHLLMVPSGNEEGSGVAAWAVWRLIGGCGSGGGAGREGRGRGAALRWRAGGAAGEDTGTLARAPGAA